MTTHLDDEERRRDAVLKSLGLKCTVAELLLEIKTAVQDSAADAFDTLEKYVMRHCPPESQPAVLEVLEEGFCSMGSSIEEELAKFSSFAKASCFYVPQGLPLSPEHDPRSCNAQGVTLDAAKEEVEELLQMKKELAEKEAEVVCKQERLKLSEERVAKAKEYMEMVDRLSNTLTSQQSTAELDELYDLVSAKLAEVQAAAPSAPPAASIPGLPANNAPTPGPGQTNADVVGVRSRRSFNLSLQDAMTGPYDLE